MKDLKNLVEKILDYTKTYSITESELYWNINSVRKPNNLDDITITWDEYEVAIRQEILYDIVFNNGLGLQNQMENDLCNYDEDNTLFRIESEKLEKEVKKIIEDFEVER